MGKHPDTCVSFGFSSSAPSCALNARRKISCAPHFSSARYGGARVHLETDRNAAFARLRETAGARSCARPPLALAPRGFDPSEMSAAEGVPAPARSPTASAESDSEATECSELGGEGGGRRRCGEATGDTISTLRGEDALSQSSTLAVGAAGAGRRGDTRRLPWSCRVLAVGAGGGGARRRFLLVGGAGDVSPAPRLVGGLAGFLSKPIHS